MTLPSVCPYSPTIDPANVQALAAVIGRQQAGQFWSSLQVRRWYEAVPQVTRPAGTYSWYSTPAQINEVRIVSNLGICEVYPANTATGPNIKVYVEKSGDAQYRGCAAQEYELPRDCAHNATSIYVPLTWSRRKAWIMPGHLIRVWYTDIGNCNQEIRLEGWRIATPYLVDKDNLQWVLPEIRKVIGGLA